MAGRGRTSFETTDVAFFGAENRRLKPPDCLGTLQKQAFLDLVTSVPRGQFRKCDLPLLCRFAELTVIAEQAAFEMQQGGMVTTDQKGRQSISPWAVLHRNATQELRLLSQRLQLGPRGRAQKAPKQTPGRVSYYDEMALTGYEGFNDDGDH